MQVPKTPSFLLANIGFETRDIGRHKLAMVSTKGIVPPAWEHASQNRRLNYPLAQLPKDPVSGLMCFHDHRSSGQACSSSPPKFTQGTVSHWVYPLLTSLGIGNSDGTVDSTHLRHGGPHGILGRQILLPIQCPSQPIANDLKFLVPGRTRL